jgi:hypothetical protein
VRPSFVASDFFPFAPARPPCASPEQIIFKLKKAEALVNQGTSIANACKQIGVSEQTYCRWRKEYGGMDTEQLKFLKKTGIIEWRHHVQHTQASQFSGWIAACAAGIFFLPCPPRFRQDCPVRRSRQGRALRAG